MMLLKTAHKPNLIHNLSRKTIYYRSLTTASRSQEWRTTTNKQYISNMATPTKVQLSANDTGIFKIKPQDAETAARTSELLQENHDVRTPLLLLLKSNY